jgi:hypothetical protein
MKKLFLLLSAGVLLIACNNEKKADDAPKNTDLIQQNLKGKVQQIEETPYTVDSVGNSKMDSSKNITDFDEKGYQTKYTNKNLSGKITMEQTISHYDNGAAKEIVNTSDGKQTFKLDIDIDKDGKYSAAKTYDSTGKQDSYYTDIKENEYGIVYAGKRYFMNGKIKETFDMKYDKTNFVGGTATDSLGRTSYNGTVTLNDKGDPIKDSSTTLVKDSTKTETITYKYDNYDDKGNWTQRTTYNDKGKPTKTVKRTYTYYKD